MAQRTRIRNVHRKTTAGRLNSRKRKAKRRQGRPREKAFTTILPWRRISFSDSTKNLRKVVACTCPDARRSVTWVRLHVTHTCRASTWAPRGGTRSRVCLVSPSVRLPSTWCRQRMCHRCICGLAHKMIIPDHGKDQRSLTSVYSVHLTYTYTGECIFHPADTINEQPAEYNVKTAVNPARPVTWE